MVDKCCFGVLFCMLLMGSNILCRGLMVISIWLVIIFKLCLILLISLISVNVLSEFMGWFVIMIICFLVGICFFLMLWVE